MLCLLRRVPMADATLAHVPAEVSDEEALLLGDIFSTGFFAADNAGIAALAAGSSGGDAAAAAAADAGPVVAVVGCGPVGVLACIGGGSFDVWHGRGACTRRRGCGLAALGVACNEHRGVSQHWC